MSFPLPDSISELLPHNPDASPRGSIYQRPAASAAASLVGSSSLPARRKFKSHHGADSVGKFLQMEDTVEADYAPESPLCSPSTDTYINCGYGEGPSRPKITYPIAGSWGDPNHSTAEQETLLIKRLPSQGSLRPAGQVFIATEKHS